MPVQVLVGLGWKEIPAPPLANVAFSSLRQAPYPTGQNPAPTTLVYPQAPQAMSTQPQTRSPVSRPLSRRFSPTAAQPRLASHLAWRLLSGGLPCFTVIWETGKDWAPLSSAPLLRAPPCISA